MHRPLLLALGLLIAATCVAEGDDSLSPEMLDKLKRSTAYIRVDIGGDQASGTGWLYDKNGRRGLVITNSHVISDKGRPADRVRVVLDSGEAGERTLTAKVLGNDPARDLAMLEVEDDALPDPIPLGNQLPIKETMAVFILGYPFGANLATAGENPSITVSRGNVSSIRKNDVGRTVMLQIDGNINPGNSGGPVVSASGELLGVTVAKLQGTQIGMAIPLADVRELLLGRIGEIRFRREPGEATSVKLAIDGRLIDPLQKLTKVSLHFIPLTELKAPPKPNEHGEWGLVSTRGREVVLQVTGEALAGSTEFRKLDPQKSLIIVQPSYVRGADAVSYDIPVLIDVLALGSGAPVDLATIDPAKRPKKPRPPIPDESWVTAPPPAANLATLGAEDAFFYQSPGTIIEVNRAGTVDESPLGEGSPLVARRLRTGSGETVPGAAWSADGERLYLGTSRGDLQVYKLPQMIEERRLVLGGPCSFVGQSREGIVALLNSSNHLAVIEPGSLAIKRYIHVPDMDSVCCAAGSPLAFVLAGKSTSELQVVDLEQGRLVGRVPAAEINEQQPPELTGFTFWQRPLRLTTDGNFLFAYSSSRVLRLAVVGTNVVFDEATAAAARGPDTGALSNDSGFLAVRSDATRNLPNHPRLTKGVYVYPIGNLERPSLAVEIEHTPVGMVLDIATRRLFTLSTEGLTVVELGGSPAKTFPLAKGKNSPKALLSDPAGKGLLAIYDSQAFWIAPAK